MDSIREQVYDEANSDNEEKTATDEVKEDTCEKKDEKKEEPIRNKDGSLARLPPIHEVPCVQLDEDAKELGDDGDGFNHPKAQAMSMMMAYLKTMQLFFSDFLRTAKDDPLTDVEEPIWKNTLIQIAKNVTEQISLLELLETQPQMFHKDETGEVKVNLDQIAPYLTKNKDGNITVDTDRMEQDKTFFDYKIRQELHKMKERIERQIDNEGLTEEMIKKDREKYPEYYDCDGNLLKREHFREAQEKAIKEGLEELKRLEEQRVKMKEEKCEVESKI